MEGLRERIRGVVQRLFETSVDVELTEAPEGTGADYATNVALKLAKTVHRSPIEVAEMIKAEMGGDDFDVAVAAPGFLNFISPDGYYLEKVRGYTEVEGDDFVKNISLDGYLGKMVVTEFSDPNPFKVLHVGHLYTSVVGDSISRLLEKAGAKVVRTNFGGDVGLHVGKTIWALLKRLQSSDSVSLSKSNPSDEGRDFDPAQPEDNPQTANALVGSNCLTIEEIAKCYIEGTRAYEEDEEAKRQIVEINKIIYDLAEMGEEKSYDRLAIEQVAEDYGWSTAEMARLAELYWQGRALSYEYFKDFYAQIGVKFDKFYPESTVVNKGREEVLAHVGTTYEESDGAVVFRGEKVGLHTRVFINAQGVSTYEAKDVGLIFTKWDDWHFDESVVITGNEQNDYMKVVLASVKEYAPELVVRTSHLTHGMVRLVGNKKMSSRKGNFLKAVDVLQVVREVLGGEEADKKVVLAAVKYAFLKYKMGGDIIFDPVESVSTTGNSGVYLLYSAVRAKKILQKPTGEQKFEKGAEQDKWVKRLCKKIVQYEEVLAQAVTEKAPYKICNYLYELAQEFSRFYENVPVAGNEEEGALREVVRGYLMVMEDGLGVLGIEVPEEM